MAINLGDDGHVEGVLGGATKPRREIRSLFVEIGDAGGVDVVAVVSGPDAGEVGGAFGAHGEWISFVFNVISPNGIVICWETKCWGI